MSYPGLSVKLPLSYDPTTARYILNTTYKEMVHQNFKNLLLTVPGERIMDIEFGVGLRTFLFEPQDPFFYQQIQTKIYEQVKIYMPYIQIDEINITESTIEDNKILVRIKYTILPLGLGNIILEL